MMRRIGFPDPAKVPWQGALAWRNMLVGLSTDKARHTCAKVGCVLTSIAIAIMIALQRVATPATVQGGGLAAKPPVWTLDRPASARIPQLARANGFACALEPVTGATQELRQAILDTLAGGGVCLLWVDTDSTDPDDTGKHWVLAHAVLIDDEAKAIIGVVHICDPATAGGKPTVDGSPPGLEALDLRTLSGCIMWGDRPRPYAVRAVRPLFPA